MFSVMREFHMSDSISLSDDIHRATYVHPRTYNRTRGTSKDPFFPRRNAFFFHDSRSRYMLLESFQRAGLVIFTAKIVAKNVCKVLRDFPYILRTFSSFFFFLFRVLCYYRVIST